MTKITSENFYAQRDFPETENKRNMIASLLNSVCKFLKFEFVIPEKSIIKVKASELFAMYEAYCLNSRLKAFTRDKFYEKMAEIIIHFKKSNGYNVYNVTIEQLKQIADINKWICYNDELVKDEDVDEDEDVNETRAPILGRAIGQLTDENEKLKLEIEKMKADYQKLIISHKEEIDKITKEFSDENFKLLEELEKCETNKIVEEVVVVSPKKIKHQVSKGIRTVEPSNLKDIDLLVDDLMKII
jgi:hypothetical protein